MATASSAEADVRSLVTPRAGEVDVLVEVEVPTEEESEEWYYHNGVWYSDCGHVAKEKKIYPTKKRAFACKTENTDRMCKKKEDTDKCVEG